MNYQIILMLKNRKYVGLTVGFGLLMFFLYSFLQQVLSQGLNNFWFWFSLLTPGRWLLFLLYVVLFGVALSFFLWQRSKKVCAVKKIAKGGFFGFAGSFLGTWASVCPTCLSWVVLFLPVSFGFSLAKYSVEIMIFSILLLFLALWGLGAFNRL